MWESKNKFVLVNYFILPFVSSTSKSSSTIAIASQFGMCYGKKQSLRILSPINKILPVIPLDLYFHKHQKHSNFNSYFRLCFCLLLHDIFCEYGIVAFNVDLIFRLYLERLWSFMINRCKIQWKHGRIIICKEHWLSRFDKHCIK